MLFILELYHHHSSDMSLISSLDLPELTLEKECPLETIIQLELDESEEFVKCSSLALNTTSPNVSSRYFILFISQDHTANGQKDEFRGLTVISTLLHT